MATRNLRTLHQRIVNLIERLRNNGSRQLREQYRVALEAIREDMRRVFDKYSSDGVLTYSEMTKYNRLDRLERQVSRELRSLGGKAGRTVDRLAETSYEASYYRYGWAISQNTGVSLSWGLIRPETIRAAVENPLAELAKRNLNRNTLQRVRTTITQGLIRGSSYSRMSADLRNAINISLNDAQRIARTESARATTLGTQASYDESERLGVKMSRVWDATLDNRTRPAHAQIDGTVATNRGTEDEPDYQWYLAGEWVRGPAQHSDPGQSINCRCAITPVVEGYEPEVRRIRDEGIQPYQTFSEWAKSRGITTNRYGQSYDFG